MTLTLQSDPAWDLGTPSAATVTVLDNENPVVTAAEAPPTITEGADVVFILTRTLFVARELEVSVEVTGGDAVLAGAAPAGVTFAAGDATATLRLGTVDDDVDDPEATVTLTLVAGHDYDLGDASEVSASVTVRDDDLPVVTVTAESEQIVEEGADLAFIIARTEGDLSRSLEVHVLFKQPGQEATEGRNRILPGDSTHRAGGFSAQNFEGDVEYVITLRPGPGYRLGTPSEATVTVRDDDAPPSVSIAGADAVTEGGTLAFPVTLSGPYNADITVAYTLGGTAAEGADYTDAGSGALTITSGDTEGTIELATVDDSADEAREEVEVTLTAGADYTLGAPSVATGRILDNEGLPEVTVAAAADAVTEGEDAVFILTREDGDASGALEVPVAIGDAAGVLLPGAPTSATFEAGAPTATLRLGTDDDNVEEPDARVTLTLAAGAAWTLGAPSEAAVTVRDNEAPPAVSVADADAVPEGGTLEFVVSLNHPSHATVTVDYGFGGTAVAGTDYEGAATGTVTFTPGVTEQRVRLVTVDNDTDEADRTVTATLAAPDPALATLGRATAAGRIEDDERPVVTIAPDASTVREGQDAVFTLTRVGDLSVALEVAVVVTDADGVLTDAAPTSVSFLAGDAAATLRLATDDDDIHEPDAVTVTVTLAAGAAWDLGTPAEATVTVRDNEARPTVSMDPRASVTEGGTLRFEVRLNRASAAEVPVEYAVSGGDTTAREGADYLGPASGTLTFAPGERRKQISIGTVDDDVDEAASQLGLTLRLPNSRLAKFPSTGAPTAFGRIRDNDLQVVTVETVSGAIGEWDATRARAVFRVRRTQHDQLSKPLTVSFTIGDEDDVLTTSPLPTSVRFEANDAAVEVELATDDDDVDEDDATVTLTLSDGTGYRRGASRRAAVTVWDNDGSRPPRCSCATRRR